MQNDRKFPFKSSLRKKTVRAEREKYNRDFAKFTGSHGLFLNLTNAIIAVFMHFVNEFYLHLQ
jgi:hypothetical protein